MSQKDEKMALMHSALLALMVDFDGLCRKHNIKYSLHAGSLLGAIRHKGFIPWDDDADISMLRVEYERLLEVFKSENDKCYILNKHGQIPIILSKERKNNCLVWLDIFIYDGISENRVARKLKLLVLTFFGVMAKTPELMRQSKVQKYSVYKRILFYTAFGIGRIFPLKWKLSWYQSISKHLFTGSGKLIHRSNDQQNAIGLVLPRTCMESYIDVPFEGHLMMVSKNYEEVLISSYGPDYMTPPPQSVIEAEQKNHGEFRGVYLGLTQNNKSRRP